MAASLFSTFREQDMSEHEFQAKLAEFDGRDSTLPPAERENSMQLGL